MRFQLSCTALGLALAAGAPAAHAQTVITRQIVDQPVETVVTQRPTGTVIAEQPLVTLPAGAVLQPETVTTETVRTFRPAPRSRAARRQVVTTRTITRRVVAAPTVIARAVPATPQPLYDEAMPASMYDEAMPASMASTATPLYDEVTPAPDATVVGTTFVVANGAVVATNPYIYRYVYQPDRILVIDPATGIAVQSIPR